ncbi:MAG: ATP synthase F1 subunit gamma [Bacteroidota bacterium]
MASLKEVRIRITSVTSTQQITKAMKMVSAAKLRRAQDAIIQMRPYAAKLKEILENLSENLDSNAGGAYAKQRPVKKILIIAVTSNRGLCGGFNANIIRNVNLKLTNQYAAQVKEGNVKILAIGKKASDYFSKKPELFAGQYNSLYSDLRFDNISPIADKIMQEFAAGEYDKVEIVYNQFKNAAVQNVTTEQFLPIIPPTKDSGAKSKKINDYIYEPSKEEIVSDLIPKSLKITLYKTVLESHAGEHGARMTSMNKATDNAQELLKALKLSYNKARQAAITGEILEIVGGAEALNG